MSKTKSDLVVSCFEKELSRRNFFDKLIKVGVAGAIATVVPEHVLGSRIAARPAPQANWRRCARCLTMFFNGYTNKGRCPAGSGGHRASTPQVVNGGDYKLPYGPGWPGQSDWRYCTKCHVLFFDGFPTKGVCPVGGGHAAQGYNFTLLHDTTGAGTRDWRFCNKCDGMFYNGWNEKGICPAGGGHVAQGYNFLLDNSVRFD